jgi:hypothetical protein
MIVSFYYWGVFYMAWVILAGLDRSGKTTAAEYYKSEGYEYVHLSAPDDKYYAPGYTGPGYIDEMVDLMMKYDNINTVFDRSWYGEKVWPEVYGREPLLKEEDYEILHEYEYRNQTAKYLLHDPNIAAHWKRIQEDTGLKPSTKDQFIKAGRAHMALISSHNFVKKTMEDFPKAEKKVEEPPQIPSDPVEPSPMDDGRKQPEAPKQMNGQSKLEMANAINSVLGNRIIKKKGPLFESLEEDMRGFLDRKLSALLGEPQEEFSINEVKILKQFCQQWQSKLKG